MDRADLDDMFRGELEMAKLERQMKKGTASMYDIRDRLDSIKSSLSWIATLLFVIAALLFAIANR